MGIDAWEAARFVDWARWVQAPCRPGTVTKKIAGGWVSVRQGLACGDVPSAPGNRVFFHAPDMKIGKAEVEEALAATRELGAARTYFWIGPAAVGEGTGAALKGVGAYAWPHVEFVALGREVPAEEARPERGCEFVVRAVGEDEIAGVAERAKAWFSPEGAAALTEFVRSGRSEAHAAFEGDEVVALAQLIPRGEWGYLGAAGTAPDKRGRGAQNALICSRLNSARGRGIRWCVSETNTVAGGGASLRNLVRRGFTPVIRWGVWRWDEKSAES